MKGGSSVSPWGLEIAGGGQETILKHSSVAGSSSVNFTSIGQFRMDRNVRDIKVGSYPSSLLDKVTRSLQSRMYNALRPGSWGHFGSEVRFEMPEITNEYRELVLVFPSLMFHHDM